MKRPLALLAALALFLPASAGAETIELVTYYPAPGEGNVDADRLHAGRATIGDPFSLLDPPDGDLPNGMLRVADQVGIGMAPPVRQLEVFIDGSRPVSGDGIQLSGSAPGLFFVDGELSLPDYSNQRGGLGLAAAAGNYGLATQPGDLSLFTQTGSLHFATTPTAGTNPSVRVTVEPDGDVGIGTPEPAGLLHVRGGNDAAANVLFTAGSDTAAAGAPAIRVGIGTETPTAAASPANGAITGNLDVNDVWLRGANRWASQASVFADNRIVSGYSPTYGEAPGPSFFDVPASGKSVTIPAGTALITWSLSCHSFGGPGVYRIRPVIGGVVGPDIICVTNEAGSHKTFSGSWATTVSGGTVTVKLQARCDAGTFHLDIGDSLSWSLIVFS